MIVLLDNGLRNLGEHSFQLVTVVGQEIRSRGLDYGIYGYRGLSADVAARTGARRHFRDSLYVGCLPGFGEILKQPSYLLRFVSERYPVHSECRTARLMNRHFRDDLASLPAAVWDPANIVVFPAMTQNQILGLAEFLAGQDVARLPKIVCQLMMDISWTPWGASAVYGEAYYRRAFERLRPFAAVLRLTAENTVLAGAYNKAFGVEIGELPVPFGGHARRRARQGTVRLGFFGYSKTEKGFNLLPDAIRRCCAAGLDATFVVQIQHGGWEAETVRTEKELRELEGVSLIEGEMETDRYIEVTNDVDVTLLPYDPLRFGVRGSGLLTEAISAGRPVIASRGLYAAMKIADGSAAGEVFTPYTSAAMADAIERLVRRIDEAKTHAGLLADAFARRHNGEAYVDAIIAL